MADVWTAADAYERFMGRWSRRAAAAFVRGPAARRATQDPRATFLVGDAARLPLPDGYGDVTVSGLMLNFTPDPAAVAGELARVTRAGGVVAAYVWDYADGMAMLRLFWDAAVALDPGAVTHDEGARFPLCRPEALLALWEGAGLDGVRCDPLDVHQHFTCFEDYWQPFLAGQGPAAQYVTSLDEEHRVAVAAAVRERLPVAPDASIDLTARAWAVAGRSPEGTTASLPAGSSRRPTCG